MKSFTHYHRVGRILMEVRFLPCKDDRHKCWLVWNTTTHEVLHFRKNGAPLNGSRGVLIGPLVARKKLVRKTVPCYSDK